MPEDTKRLLLREAKYNERSLLYCSFCSQFQIHSVYIPIGTVLPLTSGMIPGLYKNLPICHLKQKDSESKGRGKRNKASV